MREDQFIKLSLTGENAQIEYPKNPLLVRVFHELSWVEDMGSGTRNILRYAPLYFVISKLVYLFTYLPFQTVALVPVGDDTADDVLPDITLAHPSGSSRTRGRSMRACVPVRPG